MWPCYTTQLSFTAPLLLKRMASISLLLPCLVFVSCAAVAVLAQECAYTIYVKTGTLREAGTNSKISLKLYNRQGEVVSIDNLEKWGLMDRGHDYFQNGNLDIFSGRHICLYSPVCKMNVTSDATGLFAGWYLEYIEVTTVRPGVLCYDQKFEVNQWLANDEPPKRWWASKDYCPALTGALDDDGVIRTMPVV